MQIKSTYRIILLSLLLATGFIGCRGTRSVVSEARLTNADMALMEVHSNQAQFEWLSARFTGTLLWEEKSQGIAGTMRVKKDSAIFVSLAPFLGIEVARAIITPDSVKLINRIESTYYVGDLRILSSMFNADVDFYMLQSLLLGNDFQHFRADQFDLEGEDTPLLQFTASERTRKSGGGNPIRQVISVDPTNNKIRTNVIEQEKSSRALRADYKKYENISGQLIPSDLTLMFANDKEISRVELLFTRTTLDVPQNLEFSVPSRYTPINLTD